MVLLLRIVTALVLLGIVAGSLYVSSTAFYAVMGVAFFAALYEWLRLAQLPRGKAALLTAVDAALFTTLPFVVYTTIIETGTGRQLVVLLAAGVALLTVCALVWTVLAVRVFFARKTGMQVSFRASCALGLFLVPTAWLSLVVTNELFSLPFLLSVLLIVWCADVMAYFTGMTLGRHKMCPAISPKKSWEGVAGALVSVVVFGYLAGVYFEKHFTFPILSLEFGGFLLWAALSVALVLFSIAGDLFESVLKRQVNIKDSGRLLPGHGGFFDRLDAMMPTLPVALLFSLVLGWFYY